MHADIGFTINMPEPTHSRNGDDSKLKWRTLRGTIEGLTASHFTLSEKNVVAHRRLTGTL